MSDDRRERPEDGEDRHLDTDETSGLGLTEEFARIEAEIEEGTGEQERQGPPGEDAHGDDEQQGTVEWEPPAEEDESEWVPDEPPGPVASRGGSGEGGDPERRHDTGEWIGATDEAEATASGSTGSGEVPAAPAAGAADAASRADDAEPPAGASEDAAAESTAEEEGSDAGRQPATTAGPTDPSTAAGAPDPATRVQHGEPLAPAAAAASAEAPTEVRRGGPGQVTPIPPTPAAGGYEDEPAIKVPSLWLRFLSGSVLIVACVAASVAITGLFFIRDIAAKLHPIAGIQKQLTAVASDSPQTVLIIGSDKRSNVPGPPRSDTTMLLRIDPDKGVLSLFSLPRDLSVTVPGYESQSPMKLNEAYTLGGEKLTLKTVEALTHLDINHVVEINFQGFADAVNAIDCVYVDVDRHYYHSNAGLSDLDSYSEIDIGAGYQRLCGLKALQYVRYRHTDNDIVRSARQQDFLREARQKVNARELIPAPIIGGDTGNQLIDIFTKYTSSDIAHTDDIIGILKSFIAVRNVPVNQIHFEGDLGDATNTNVTTTHKQLQKALDEFLNGPGGSGEQGGGSNGSSKKKKDKKKNKDKSAGVPQANVVPVDQLADPTAFEKDAAKDARRLKFPIYSPSVVAEGSSFSSDSRTYKIKDESDNEQPAYKTVIEYAPDGQLPEYYGIEGTTWSDPPILRHPSETRTIDGRDYLLFYDAGRLRLVGWHDGSNSYWLNNTLSQTLDEDQMLAIATTMRKVD